jgi:hypothetical protein
MADIAQLPTLPQTVALEGAQLEGDPLEYIRAKARENIETVEKNPVIKEPEKLEFKKYVLSGLDEYIKKFKEIDDKYAAQKAEEEAKKSAEEKDLAKEEDPFADIFKDEPDKPDEATQEKLKLASEFALNTKNYREKYLKDLIKANEHKSKQNEEEKLNDILGKLNEPS